MFFSCSYAIIRLILLDSRQTERRSYMNARTGQLTDRQVRLEKQAAYQSVSSKIVSLAYYNLTDKVDYECIEDEIVCFLSVLPYASIHIVDVGSVNNYKRLDKLCKSWGLNITTVHGVNSERIITQ